MYGLGVAGFYMIVMIVFLYLIFEIHFDSLVQRFSADVWTLKSVDQV